VSAAALTRATGTLALELERLRLLLRRRILWLRATWVDDPLRSAGRLAIGDAEADALAVPPDPEAEAFFLREDEAAARLGEAIAALEGELAQPSQPGSLDRLAERIGLDRLDRDLLVLALAPELDPGFERLYAYVLDDATRRFATPRLATDLFGAQATARIGVEAPLRRLHLVELAVSEDGWASMPLRVRERVLMHLRGLDQVDPRAAELLRPLDEAPPAGDGAALAERLAGLFAERSSWPIVQLLGPLQSGGRAIAAAACVRLGLRLVALAPAAARRLRERPELVAAVEREAVLLSLALWIEDGAAEDWAELAERVTAPIFAGGCERMRTEASLIASPLPAPDPAALRELWSASLPAGVDPVPLAEQFALAPGEIAAAVADAEASAALHGAERPSSEEVWAACRTRARGSADGLARVLAVEPCWQRLVLPAAAMAQLEDLVAQAATRRQVYEEWGFESRLPRGRGLTALFAGPSGTGKTMAAEALAARLGLDLYAVDLAGVVSKWIGETEKNLRRVFEAAERAGAVLFFDEADALFAQRSEKVRDAHDRHGNAGVDHLLQEMEKFCGVAILATNRRNLVDPALLRRLRFLVEFPFPELADRVRLWRGVFPPRTPLGELDWEALGRLELSGGSIRTIAVNAAFLAASDGGALEMEHVMRAAKREYRKLDRRVLAAEFGEWA
jgi:hypothetical protein